MNLQMTKELLLAFAFLANSEASISATYYPSLPPNFSDPVVQSKGNTFKICYTFGNKDKNSVCIDALCFQITACKI